MNGSSNPRVVQHALVLAAGRSTRIAGELEGRSKLLIDLGGETVLERNLRWIADAGVTDVWINLHYRPDDIRSLIGDGSRMGLRVRFSHEPELLGTAGAFANLHAHWTGAVLVVYGDNVSRFDVSALLRRHAATDAAATVALFDAQKHRNSGIAGGRVVVDRDDVVAFAEGEPIDSPLVNAGVYVLQPEVAEWIPGGGAPDFGRTVFPRMLAGGVRIGAHIIEDGGYCFGIDTPEALARTRAALASEVATR